jgi:hypothetical protein
VRAGEESVFVSIRTYHLLQLTSAPDPDRSARHLHILIILG